MSDEQKNEIEMPASKADVMAMPVTDEGIVPSTLSELWYMAKMIASSAFCPKGMQKTEDVFLALVHGRSLGLRNPLQAVQNIAVINGRPCIYGDAIPGIIFATKLLVDFHEFYEGEWGTDGFKAVCVIKRKDIASEFRTEFSWLDAKTAGLTSKEGPWKQYPKRMLQMRARGFCARNAFPDALKGFLMIEEEMDAPKTIDVTDESEVVKDLGGLKSELKKKQATEPAQPEQSPVDAKKRGRPRKEAVPEPTTEDDTAPWEEPVKTVEGETTTADDDDEQHVDPETGEIKGELF